MFRLYQRITLLLFVVSSVVSTQVLCRYLECQCSRVDVCASGRSPAGAQVPGPATWWPLSSHTSFIRTLFEVATHTLDELRPAANGSDNRILATVNKIERESFSYCVPDT